MPDPAYRFAQREEESIDWRWPRYSAVTPAQTVGVYASVGAPALLVAVFCWLLGARLVMVFTGLELLVLGVAFVWQRRHADDGERIVLRDGRLLVELAQAGVLRRTEFQSAWVRVELARRPGALIEVSGQGRRVEVGRYVRPEWRASLAAEIRRALRTGC